MKRAWLTPNDAPGVATCRPVFLPAGFEYEAAFRGAFLLLCEVFNWEKVGTQTPETVSEVFYEAFLQTVAGWGECAVSGLYVGEVRAFANVPLPDGWVTCDGTLYAFDAYPDLFAYLGNLYGGNGTTTFCVPNLNDRVIIGAGSYGDTPRNIADAGGEETHVLTEAELPAHHHTVPYHNGSGAQTRLATVSTSSTPANLNTSDIGSGAAHENMQPWMALVFGIYAGI